VPIRTIDSRLRKATSRVGRMAVLQSPLAITAVGIAALVTVGACAPTSTSSSGGSGSVTAMCSLTSLPRPSVTPLPTSAPSPAADAPGTVGVILPGTTPPTRSTPYDAPLLQAVLDAGGVTSDIQNAQGDPVRFEQIAQSMIGEGVRVLIIDSIDPTSASAVEQQAVAAGVTVIDYDRATLHGSVSSVIGTPSPLPSC
jgi:D-xylose transport system substrate-binding protein